MKKYLTTYDINPMVVRLAHFLNGLHKNPQSIPLKIYGIPRGGIPVAYLLTKFGFILADTPEEADIFVDDIIDSGRTLERWCDEYPGKPFFALIDAENKEDDTWYVFPWEVKDPLKSNTDDSIAGTILNRIKLAGAPYFANDNIAAFLEEGDIQKLQDEVATRILSVMQGLVIDVDNDHNTQDTAKRVAKMYLQEVFKGRYEKAPAKTFFPNAKKLDEMYITGPISIRSTCSHHFVPIIGQCWVGVIPGESVIGLSKFNRIIDWLASRPQIQEELIIQIADELEKTIKPRGLAIVLKANHMCMTWRGVKEPGDSLMTNSVMRGIFREKPEARAEFMALIK